MTLVPCCCYNCEFRLGNLGHLMYDETPYLNVRLSTSQLTFAQAPSLQKRFKTYFQAMENCPWLCILSTWSCQLIRGNFMHLTMSSLCNVSFISVFVYSLQSYYFLRVLIFSLQSSFQVFRAHLFLPWSFSKFLTPRSLRIILEFYILMTY